MLNNKKKQTLCLYSRSFDGESERLLIESTKTLIGSSKRCHIIISDPYISSIHAFITVEQGDYFIQDLGSLNGLSVNGQKVERTQIEAGDQILIADKVFHVDELAQEDAGPLINSDSKVKKFAPHKQKDLSEATEAIVPLEGLEIIDGEYCDIHFSQLKKVVYDSNPLLQASISNEHFVDIDDANSDLFLSPEVDESDIITRNDSTDRNKKIEISVFLMGVLVEHRLLDITSGKYHLSSKKQSNRTIYCEELQYEKDLPIFAIDKNEKLIPLEQTELEYKQISAEELHFSNQHNVQIIAQITNDSSQINLTPFYHLDQVTKKEALKVFGIFLVFFITMILVPTTEMIDPEEESISIVYRPTPVESPTAEQEQTSPTPEPEAQEQGVTETDVSQEPPQKAVAAASQPVEEAPPKEEPPQPAPTEIAQAPEPEPEPAPERTFELNTRSRMERMASNRQSASVAQVQNQRREVARSSQTNRERSMDAPSREVGRIGQDTSGTQARSAGARGLASREGIASTYMEPKTVVLGSMDPELLRKILREYLPQFKHCYQQELDRQSDELAGVLDLNFRILSSGQIDRVKIEVTNSDFSNSGTNCMTSVLHMIEFPQPKGGGVVDVRQPLNFSAERQRI